MGHLLWMLMAVEVLLTLSEIWPENEWVTYNEWVISRTRLALGGILSYSDFVRFFGVVESISALTALGMGLLVLRFKSRDGMGLFVSAVLMSVAPWYLSSNMEQWRLSGWVPFQSTLAFLQGVATLAGLLLFFYLFPDGRFVPRWTRRAEIRERIAQGHNDPEIARRLVLSPKRVRNHISNIFSKLQVADRRQAIVRAREAALG